MNKKNPKSLKKNRITELLVLTIAIGSILYIAALLPSKHGVDPLGTGKLLGLNNLSSSDSAVENKVQKTHALLKLEKLGSKAEIKKPIEANNPAPKEQLAQREDEIKVTVPAGKGIEYKINMLKYGQLKYEWSVDEGTLYFDFHGEVKEVTPAKDVYWESYTMAYSNNMVGTFLSPFEGKHGWYFKNIGQKDIVVSIRLKGQYVLI